MPEENRTAKDIMLRLKQLEDIRRPWEGMWEEIIDYVIPRLGDIRGSQEKGQKHGQKVYDGTAITALELLADGFHGYLVSPSMQWFRLRMANRLLEEIPAVKEWLQEAEKALYSAFQRSNFYEAMSQYFLDGGSIGTAAMYIEEDIRNDRIVFSTRHPKECFIAEDSYGNIDTLFRKFKITAKQAKERFDLEKLSDNIKRAAENAPYEEFEFIHAVFPRDEYDEAKKDNLNKPFASVYVQADGQRLASESGYNTFPYSVWRWRKHSNETYGRSPASDALVDILGLNQMSKTLLGAAQNAVDPPMNVPAEQKGKVRLVPHGINYYEETGRMIFPVNQGINYPVGVDREEKKKQAIEKHFKVDFFLMLANAQRQMTATEIVERMGEKAAVLGTTIGRLNSECLNPLIDRIFDIELNKTTSSLQPVPDELYKYGGESIEVDYLGPLAQAQKRLFKTQGVLSSLERIVPIIQANPQTADIIDWDTVVREVLDAYGMPQKAIRPEEMVKALREQKMQEQQAMMMQKSMGEAAEGAKKLAEADKASDGKLSKLLEEQMGVKLQ
jgi:hypothetical protein